MKKRNVELKKASELRKRAVEKFKSKPALPEKLSQLDVRELIEELRIHQIQLEMQNDELRKAQQVVEESRAKYSDLYDFAPVGYLTLNKEGLILEANLTACSQLRRDRNRLIRKPFFLFMIKQEDRDQFYRYLRKVFETKTLETCEIGLKGKDSSPFYAQLESIVVKDNLSQCRTAITDITERKKAHDEIQKTKEDLEVQSQDLQRANAITRSLYKKLEEKNEALKKTTEELARSNKDLEQFAYAASHDLQAPLRQITAFGMLLLEKNLSALDEESQDYVGRMVKGAKKMRQLIDDLLNYSRIMRQEALFERVDLNTMMDEALSNLGVTIRDLSAEIEVDELPKINAVGVQMLQLFQNLIENALKFRKKGEPPRVKVRSQDLASGFYEITIEDNGIGFDERHVDRIFVPFQQLHAKAKYEGTGIGLAICKRIVEGHGGEIRARSSRGQGTTFVVTLPNAQRSERLPYQPAISR